ncbi:MAG TPA: DUF4396 domain-containing protein [Caulobacteraceae bacterium]|jgi:hypothetical protein|nr:DUF4396 domain-containing protein [Caulobacteraceae bacterium]
MAHAHFPVWLHALSILSLAVAIVCAAAIVIDETRRRQRMWIMALVWPLTALFGSLLWLAFYWRWGRGADPRQSRPQPQDAPQDTPMPVAIAKSASHCGAGCALGDLIAEWLAFAVPGVALAFGWKTLFADKTFAVWVLDFVVAFALGVAFQYFTIAPVRHLSPKDGIVAALKADAASIASWQAGMYAAMAAIQFLWLRPAYGSVAPVDSPEFWFAMQIAMLCGFVTAYPINWLLVKTGVKERM